MTDNAELVLTPTVARVARRALLWVGVAFLLLVVALIAGIFSGGGESGVPMSATNAAPDGAKALVEVLRDHGVEVVVTDTLDTTIEAVVDPATTTVFVYDVDVLLSSDQEEQLFDLARSVVVLDPSPTIQTSMSPDIAAAGYLDGVLGANCDVNAARTAQRITSDGSGYRVLADTTDVTTCFRSDDVYSMLQVQRGDTTITALGATSALSNGVITEAGNAAFGLNLLGENERLVWYIPTEADYDSGTADTSQLAPGWVSPVAITLLLAGLAAMFWRGRRLGPLVVENLPVTVRASETMRGRARLYEQSNARLHSLDSLRIGTISRIANACGLSVTATTEEVILAAAGTSNRDVRQVRALLLDEVPTSDRALVQLSDKLLELERQITENLRPH